MLDTVLGYDEGPVVAACPTCGGVVEVPVAAEGTTFDCPSCDELLMVTDLEPLMLAVASDPDEVAFPDPDERRE